VHGRLGLPHRLLDMSAAGLSTCQAGAAATPTAGCQALTDTIATDFTERLFHAIRHVELHGCCTLDAVGLQARVTIQPQQMPGNKLYTIVCCVISDVDFSSYCIVCINWVFWLV
jgi:hypothetical protein